MTSMAPWFLRTSRWLYETASSMSWDLSGIVVCPEIYQEFCAGDFVVQKNLNSFSSIAPEQAHEQNNAVIKWVGKAADLLSSGLDAALRRWEVAGLEVCELLSEY